MGFLDNLLRTMVGRPEASQLEESERLRLEVVHLYQEGRFAEAEIAARRLVDLQRELLGEDHPDYASALSNLALLLQQQGDLDAAEPLLKQSLDVRRSALGEHHADYAASLNNLALLLCERGDLDAAEPLLKQALEVRRVALGEDHPDYATGLGSLALFHCERGDLDAAEPLLTQAVEVRRLALGEDHPDFATSINNLALFHCERGDLDAAEPLLRRALEVRRQTLGEQHADTRSSAESLSLLLLRKGSAGGDVAADGASTVDASAGADSDAPEIAGPSDEIRPPAQAVAGRSRDPNGVPNAATLSDELAALSRAFANVSEQMLQEAALMQEPGLPPDLVVLSAASACHRSFMALRGEALRLADRLHVRSHTAGRILGLQDLSGLLDAIARAEDARAEQEAVRRRALEVLEQVLALSCRDADDQPYLDECLGQARVLHNAILTCDAGELPLEAERLARGEHPLAWLLALAEDQDGVSGESWADRYKETAAAFGRNLAVAAARGRISRAAVEAPLEAEAV